MLNRLARGLKQNLCLLCGKIYANKSYPIGRLNLVRLTNAIDDALFCKIIWNPLVYHINTQWQQLLNRKLCVDKLTFECDQCHQMFPQVILSCIWMHKVRAAFGRCEDQRNWFASDTFFGAMMGCVSFPILLSIFIVQKRMPQCVVWFKIYRSCHCLKSAVPCKCTNHLDNQNLIP